MLGNQDTEHGFNETTDFCRLAWCPAIPNTHRDTYLVGSSLPLGENFLFFLLGSEE